MSILDDFGRLAETAENQTIVAGRYAFQADDEANIVPDLPTGLGRESMLRNRVG